MQDAEDLEHSNEPNYLRTRKRSRQEAPAVLRSKGIAVPDTETTS